MIIDILKLLNGQEEVIAFNRQIQSFIAELDCVEPINVDGRIYKDGEILEITLRIDLHLMMECSRCMEDFVCPLEFRVKESLNITKNQEMLKNESLDLSELIRDTIFVNLPIKPLCSNECKGLCCSCGTNKNHQDCKCNNDPIDPRLSVLNKLLNGDEGEV